MKIFVCVVVLGCSAFLPAAASAARAREPNTIFILGEDVGIGNMSSTVTVLLEGEHHSTINAVEHYDQQTKPPENAHLAKLPVHAGLGERLMLQKRADRTGALPFPSPSP